MSHSDLQKKTTSIHVWIKNNSIHQGGIFQTLPPPIYHWSLTQKPLTEQNPAFCTTNSPTPHKTVPQQINHWWSYHAKLAPKNRRHFGGCIKTTWRSSAVWRLKLKSHKVGLGGYLGVLKKKKSSHLQLKTKQKSWLQAKLTSEKGAINCALQSSAPTHANRLCANIDKEMTRRAPMRKDIYCTDRWWEKKRKERVKWSP